MESVICVVLAAGAKTIRTVRVESKVLNMSAYHLGRRGHTWMTLTIVSPADILAVERLLAYTAQVAV